MLDQRQVKYRDAIYDLMGYDINKISDDDIARWLRFDEVVNKVMALADDEKAESYAEGHDDGYTLGVEIGKMRSTS